MIGQLFGINKNAVRDHLANYAKYGDEEGTSGREMTSSDTGNSASDL
jgi:hypothetical protein